MNRTPIKPILLVFACLLSSAPALVRASQETATQAPVRPKTAQETSDRAAILETIKNFYIGDKTGSLEHKKLSLHEKGAYRYVDREGNYGDSQFRLVEGGGDTSYEEELLGVEIYGTLGLARLRLVKKEKPAAKAEYKLMTLHKSNAGWRITSICWGFGVIN